MIEYIIANYINPGISYFPFLPSFWYNWKQEDIHKRNIVSVSHPVQPIFVDFDGRFRTANWNNPTDLESKLATASDFSKWFFYVCKKLSKTSRFKYHWTVELWKSRFSCRSASEPKVKICYYECTCWESGWIANMQILYLIMSHMESKQTASSINGEADRSTERDFLWMCGHTWISWYGCQDFMKMLTNCKVSWIFSWPEIHTVFTICYSLLSLSTNRVRKTMSGDWYDQSTYLMNSQDWIVGAERWWMP